MPSIDLKHNKNNEIQKQYSNSKKNISRKTTSRTIKLDNSLGTGYLSSLLRQVKDTKRGDTAKSKSPANRRRSKSGGKNKLEPKSASRELKYKS